MAEKSGQSGPQWTVVTRTRGPRGSGTKGVRDFGSRCRAGRIKGQGWEFLGLAGLPPSQALRRALLSVS